MDLVKNIRNRVSYMPKVIYESMSSMKKLPPTPEIMKAEAVLMIVKMHLRPYIRLYGLIGGVATIALAYGAHGKFDNFHSAQDIPIKDYSPTSNKLVFQRAAQQQMYTALALLGVGFSRFPMLTLSMLLVGSTMFSGSCYYSAVSGDKRFLFIAPYGGFLQIIAWFLMAL